MTVRVAVLGQGQLGTMLRSAGERLGLEVDLLSPEQPVPPEASVPITVEAEHWPDNPGTRALQQHPGWRNAEALKRIPDRRLQKQMLDQLALPTAPWCLPDESSDAASLQAKLGDRLLLKRARGGYDGRGQHRVSADTGQALPEWRDQAIAEAMIDFESEVSLVGARGPDGQCVFYPLTENYHRQGVLRVSVHQQGRLSALQSRAEQMLGKILDALDYTGVMAMECFVLGDQLLINELAPRVHNSGHWTQAGASICQFELHWRALLGWPLLTPEAPGTSVMVNLLGVEHQPDWLSAPGARLHWYRKSVRPGRKVGHINFHHSDPERVAEGLRALNLPEDYQSSLDWALALVSSEPQR